MKKRTGAFVALMVLALSGVMVGNAVAAPLPGQSYSGDAYGTYAYVGNTIVSGKSSLIAVPCAAQPGYHASANAVGVNVAGVLTTGAINTMVSVGQSTTSKSETSSANVAGANVLSGLISADTVTAVSTTSLDSTGYHVSPGGSSLVGLVVAGVPISVTPDPNTTINLPGVGKVVLNEQIRSITSKGASLTVNMIHVYITTGAKAGTQIVVGHAFSGLTTRTPPTLTGYAYSSYATVGKVVTSGPNFAIGFCGDTGGVTRVNQAASSSIPGILSTGTLIDTVKGTVSAHTGVGESTSTVQNVNLASGLVTADAVKADAHAQYASGGTVTASANGTTFTNLKVNGVIEANVKANTRIQLGNITVWLNRQNKSANGIEVRMIEITVSGTNLQGLPVGTDIRVADAQTYAYPAG